MTASPAADDEAATVALGAAIAGIRGHVVLSSSADRIAIWQVTPTGQKSGAWVYSLDDTREQAQRILTLVQRRAIAGTDRDDDITMLRRIAQAAAVSLPSAYAQQWIDLREILAEVVATRQRLSQLVEEHGAKSAGSLQPLAYTYQIEDVSLPGDALRALAVLGLALPQEGETEPIARTALAKANILGAAIARWVDTESARLRRTYLRQEGGSSARPLPPEWLSRLTAVYTAPFDF
jgi:hypothetical protein